MDKVASAVGMTRPTLTKAKAVVEAGELIPEGFPDAGEASERAACTRGDDRHPRYASGQGDDGHGDQKSASHRATLILPDLGRS